MSLFSSAAVSIKKEVMEFNLSWWQEWHLKTPPSSVDPVCIVTFCGKGQTITKTRRGEKMFDDLSPLKWKRLRLLWEADVDTVVPRMKLLFTVPWTQRDETSKSTNSERLPGGCSCSNALQEAVTCLLSITQSGAVNVPVYIPAVGFPASFLLVQTWLGCHYRSVHVPERAPVSAFRGGCIIDGCVFVNPPWGCFVPCFQTREHSRNRSWNCKNKRVRAKAEGGTGHICDCVRDLCSLKHLESVLNLNPTPDYSKKHP